MYDVSDVVVYVVGKLGGCVEGVKKLMKLLFLVQYERARRLTPWRRRLVLRRYEYRGEPVTRARWFVWSYGPMSNEVYDVIDESPLLTVDFDSVPVRVCLADRSAWRRTAERLPGSVRERVDAVLRRHGDRKGYELERLCLSMLELDELKKSDYMGVTVKEYVEREGGRVEPVELLGH